MKKYPKHRILFIMPSMVAGGAERVLINLLNLMDKEKYEAKLIVVEQKGKLWDNVPSHVEKMLLFPHLLLCKIGIYLLRTFQIDWVFRFYGKQITGEYDAAVSFLDSIHTEFLFYNKAKIHKRIAVIHSSYKSYSNKSKFIKGGYKNLMMRRYSRMDTIVSVAEESLIQFKELFGEYPDMRVIYNPINCQDIIKESLKDIPKQLSDNKFNFVAVGSLLPVKGYDLLIDSCDLLKKQGLDFRVYILGDGYLKDMLQNKINDLGLKDNIYLIGFVKNPYVWIKHAEVLVMTSKAEGLPTVLCEAMILGTPALVPNVPGCREVIGYGKYAGMFERHPDEMAKYMKDIMTDKALYKSYVDKAKERGKIFDDQKVLQKYYDIFNKKVEK